MLRHVIIFLLLSGSQVWALDPALAARKIDALLVADWKAREILPNPPASDEVFVRRIYLDAAGRIPSAMETRAFLADPNPGKRTELIDRLVNSEGHALHFFHFYADLLRVLSKGTYNGLPGENMGTAYANYVMESIRANKPFDQLARELVTAQGNSWENGAIGYYQRDRGMPLENLAITSRVFLGTRIECAQCHDHPFEAWTQRQFYGLAAYTYGVQTAFGTYSPAFLATLDLNRQRREKAGGQVEDETFLRQAFSEMTIPLRHNSVIFRPETLRLPADYQYPDAKPLSAVEPAVLFGKPAPVAQGQARLEAFGTWLTSPENPRFTKVIANRLWREVFGVGVIEPVDDWSDSIPPSRLELVTHLESLMKEVRYDLRAFLRVLYRTQAYQQMATRIEWSPGANYRFTGPLLRRMKAEQLWDSLVTLILPTPDLPNLEAREAIARKLANARKVGDALEAMPAAESLALADSLSAIFRDHAQTLVKLQSEMAEARNRGDEARVKALGAEMGQLRKSEIQAANDSLFVPAVKRLAEKRSGQPIVIPAGATYENIPIPGYDPAPLTAAREAEERTFQEELGRYVIANPESYLKHRRLSQIRWTRAAELPSPASSGHPLREFGQSDRELVENANTDASVPQALVLMNNEIVPQILSPYSQVKLTMGLVSGADAKVEAIYLTLLSRKPTPEETATWQAARARGLDNVDDLIFALLNTQQFLFIQ